MRVLAALLFLISLAPPPAVEAQDPGPVVFSELMWMGSEASSADEWIELYNRGGQSIDLSGWTITRVGSDGTEGVMLTVEAGSIGVGETFLIANYKPDSDRSRLATTVQFVSTAVALPNTKLMLRLYDAPEGGTLIDVADDGTGRPLGGVTEPPSSMVREAFELPGTRAEAWSTASESRGWRSDASEKGTPGSLPTRLQPAADARATGVSAMTWSHAKARDRQERH